MSSCRCGGVADRGKSLHAAQSVRENKYDAGEGFSVPDLTEVMPAGGRIGVTTNHSRRWSGCAVTRKLPPKASRYHEDNSTTAATYMPAIRRAVVSRHAYLTFRKANVN